jgi:rhodanese-related sulfurtransferase
MEGRNMIREVEPAALKQRLDTGKAPDLLDVREDWEAAICKLPGAKLIPMNEIPGRVAELDPERELVVYCHHGVRSAHVCAWLMQQGFEKVANLAGGIEEWAAAVDPGMARY